MAGVVFFRGYRSSEVSYSSGADVRASAEVWEALRSIGLCPKHVLVSTCLLLVLANGTMTQIVAQPTVWAVTIGCHLTWGCERLDVLVNGMPYCIDDTPASIQSKVTDALQQNQPAQIPIPLVANVYEGTCDNPDALVGPIAGTITIDIPGLSERFTVMLVFAVGHGLMDYHSEARFTGDLQLQSEPLDCALKNVVSEYAFVRGTGLGGIGLNFDLELLRLEPESGDCTLVDDVLWLPTFVFSERLSGITVGGIVTPANALAVLLPWLAVIGLVSSIAALVVIAKKRSA